MILNFFKFNYFSEINKSYFLFNKNLRYDKIKLYQNDLNDLASVFMFCRK